MPTDSPRPNEPNEPTPTPPLSVPPFELDLFGQLRYDPATRLHVAAGLTIRTVGRTGEPVPYTSRRALAADSGPCRFHAQPDGGATFADAALDDPGGGFTYCSNSEDEEHGGVYCLAFDADCEVRDYAKRMGGHAGDGCGAPPGAVTSVWNCSGGRTPWNTWVSCEEGHPDDLRGGHCFQVDPYGRRDPQRLEQIPPGALEAMATDDAGAVPVFYFTEDWDDGAVRRFTPSAAQIPAGWDTLHPDMDVDGGRGAAVDFLVFDDRVLVDPAPAGDGGDKDKDKAKAKEEQRGTFHWSADMEDGRRSADEHYPWTEGIAFAVVGGRRTLFFVAKKLESIFQLDLGAGTWVKRSTNADLAGGGSYLSQPDHLYFYGDKWLFHAEDESSTPGVYLQDVQSDRYYTIFEDKDPVDWGDGEETTGIAVSPDGRCLIGCLQEKGECFVVKRDDGGSFDLADQRRR